MRNFALVAMVVFLFGCAVTEVSLPTRSSVENWYEEGRKYLVVRADGRPLDRRYLRETRNYPRCALLNNYWCIKSPDRWIGAVAKDEDDHTVFKNAEAGASAAAFLLREYVKKKGRNSTYKIISVYAPASDCKGSGRGKNPDGSCRLKQFPKEYAKFIAKKMGYTNSEGEGDRFAEIKFFNYFGRPNKNFRALMKYIAIFEVGLRPRDELIEAGINGMNSACRKRC